MRVLTAREWSSLGKHPELRKMLKAGPLWVLRDGDWGSGGKMSESAETTATSLTSTLIDLQVMILKLCRRDNYPSGQGDSMHVFRNYMIHTLSFLRAIPPSMP